MHNDKTVRCAKKRPESQNRPLKLIYKVHEYLELLEQGSSQPRKVSYEKRMRAVKIVEQVVVAWPRLMPPLEFCKKTLQSSC